MSEIRLQLAVEQNDVRPTDRAQGQQYRALSEVNPAQARLVSDVSGSLQVCLGISAGMSRDLYRYVSGSLQVELV